MRAASDDVPYEQQNLWIIDERLAYHGYLASDLPLHTANVLGNESLSRPDLMLFDRALTFAEDEAVLNSLVIVEFKKPDRSNYRNEDPIEQVYRLIREIKGGHFKDRRGIEIKVQSEKFRLTLTSFAIPSARWRSLRRTRGSSVRRTTWDTSGITHPSPHM